MDDDLKQNLTASETWIRGFFILLFVFLLVVARVVTGAVVVIQFLFTVFSGQTNDNLRYFGASLAAYVYQALLFVTYNSDDKPFPFAPWPTPTQNAGPAVEAPLPQANEAVASDDEQEVDEHEPRS
jgi:nitrogen fixation-related uncharacterized protein